MSGDGAASSSPTGPVRGDTGVASTRGDAACVEASQPRSNRSTSSADTLTGPDSVSSVSTSTSSPPCEATTPTDERLDAGAATSGDDSQCRQRRPIAVASGTAHGIADASCTPIVADAPSQAAPHAAANPALHEAVREGASAWGGTVAKVATVLVLVLLGLVEGVGKLSPKLEDLTDTQVHTLIMLAASTTILIVILSIKDVNCRHITVGFVLGVACVAAVAYLACTAGPIAITMDNHGPPPPQLPPGSGTKLTRSGSDDFSRTVVYANKGGQRLEGRPADGGSWALLGVVEVDAPPESLVDIGMQVVWNTFGNDQPPTYCELREVQVHDVTDMPELVNAWECVDTVRANLTPQRAGVRSCTVPAEHIDGAQTRLVAKQKEKKLHTSDGTMPTVVGEGRNAIPYGITKGLHVSDTVPKGRVGFSKYAVVVRAECRGFPDTKAPAEGAFYDRVQRHGELEAHIEGVSVLVRK